MDWLMYPICFLGAFLLWYILSTRNQTLEGLSDERECLWDPVYNKMRCHPLR